MASMKSYSALLFLSLTYCCWVALVAGDPDEDHNVVFSDGASSIHVLVPNHRRGFLFGTLSNLANWFTGGSSSSSSSSSSSNGVDLTVPPLSCNIKRYENVANTGSSVGLAKNIQSAELCVAVCWQFKKQGKGNCASVNYHPSSKQCELKAPLPSQGSNLQQQSDSVYLIPVSCEQTGGSGGSVSGGSGGSGTPSGQGEKPVGETPPCGYTFVTPNVNLAVSARSKARIVGGTEAAPNSYPWIVSLQQGPTGSSHFCGGALIRVSQKKDESDIVVTASHCLEENPRNLHVVAGAHHTTGTSPGKVSLAAATFQKHPFYNHETTVNDIAIVKLEKPIQFTDKIQPVCLPPQGEPVNAGDTAVVAGWGTLQEGTIKLPGRLMQAPVPVVPDSKCQQFYGSDVNMRYMFCAGYDKGGKDSCQGDSGGPLVFKTSNGWTLRGVVSFGEGCARAQKPGVYTRVSFYRNWIEETARRLTSVQL